MPCLIITGHPSAGKTTLAHKLKEQALQHPLIDEALIVNEESACPDYTKAQCYETAAAEKQTRGALKAAFDRANKSDRTLVILDSQNYIKGFRYELHCISKAAGDRHGILWVLNRLPVVMEWNSSRSPSEGYPLQLLKELIQRYEPPDERNRWDKPLYTIDMSPIENRAVKDSKSEALSQSVYNMHALDGALGRNLPTAPTSSTTGNVPIKPKPKRSAFTRAKAKTEAPPQEQMPAPKESRGEERETNSDTQHQHQKVTLEESLTEILNNFLLNVQPLKQGASTQQHIATGANVLQELDSTTQKLVSAISSAQNFHTGGKLQVNSPGSGETLLMECNRTVALPELRRLRKQFMNWIGTHPPKDTTERGVEEWFLRYIEDQL